MEYFTQQEINDVRMALRDVSGVGINVDSHPGDEQRSAFFDKAKLWRVIERIISVLYIQRLSEGKMFLRDKDGDEYRVVKEEQNGKS